MSDLSDMFTEVAAEEEGELAGVDNPDGADHEEPDVLDDEIEDDEDADTSDSDDIDDDVEDDEPVAEDDDFNWNEILEKYGDRTVPLKVAGEEKAVKLSDLPNMAMMREDYSRKTAELAEVRKAAQWAQDVQASFANDPEGTLRAFADAYGIQAARELQQAVEQDDPYEDLDPDVAAVLRKMDEAEARHQAELQQMRQRVDQFQNQQIMEEVKAEVKSLREEFGDELDHVEMLRVAAHHNVPLREAAEYLVGRQYFAKSKEQLAAEAQAKEASKDRTQRDRARSKKRASGTATKRFDASDVSVEDFNTIGELFEIEMNSISP